MRTPSAIEGEGGASSAAVKKANGNMLMLRDQMADLVVDNGLRSSVSSLLPTVTTQDASNTGGPSQGLRNNPPPTISPILLPTPVASEGLKAPSQQNSETKAKTGQVWLSNIAKDIQENND